VTTPYRQIIAACLIVFAVYWAWGVRQIRPVRRSESATSAVFTSILMWVGFALIALGSVRRSALFSLALPASTARSIAGTTLVVIGVGIALWSRHVLGTNWSGVVRITEGQQLITNGPYRLVRNPIYSGMLLAATGIALASGALIGVLGLAIAAVSLWRKALIEEKLLASEYGEQYAAYARRTKRLIPFVL
jgi:protein-S-isoprenylcysteine O-methyltransferase Ste14